MKQNKHNGTREGERQIVANKAATARRRRSVPALKLGWLAGRTPSAA
jgi:hypothetical protein